MRGEPARERVASRGTPAFPTGRGHPSQIPRNPMRKRTRTPKKPKPSLTDLPPHTHPPSITAAKATTTAACPRPRRRVPSGRGSPARTTSHDAASPPTSTTKTRTPSRCVSFHHIYVRAIRLTAYVLFGFVYSGWPTAPTFTRARRCLLYTSPSPRDVEESRMPSSA